MADERHSQAADTNPAALEPDAATRTPVTETDQNSVATLQAELADTKAKLQRAVAEQENIRRQMQRQRDEAVKFAASRLAEDLIDTLDNLRLAIESAAPGNTTNDALGPLLKGVRVTEANLLATLARHCIKRIDPLGAPFDPHFHHAVSQQADPIAAEGTVIEVLQPGYLLHDRVLRPAMVSVAGR